MKSKSPSPDSRRSTPKAKLAPQPSYTPVALSFSQRPQRRSKQHCSSGSSPRSLLTLLLFPFLLFPFLLSACYVPPGSSKLEATAPNAQTIAPSPDGVTQTIKLSLQTPTPAWQLVPLTLYQIGENEYLCVHTLTPPEGMVAQMLSSTTNTITFRHTGQSEPATKHYVLGKTWKWNGNPEITFIESLDEIKDALADAQSVPFTTD